jgi:hypothetical protein
MARPSCSKDDGTCSAARGNEVVRDRNTEREAVWRLPHFWNLLSYEICARGQRLKLNQHQPCSELTQEAGRGDKDLATVVDVSKCNTCGARGERTVCQAISNTANIVAPQQPIDLLAALASGAHTLTDQPLECALSDVDQCHVQSKNQRTFHRELGLDHRREIDRLAAEWIGRGRALLEACRSRKREPEYTVGELFELSL